MPDEDNVVAFIDPQAALGALTPKAKIVDVDLGPSGPHQIDEPVEAEVQVPAVGFGPGAPPVTIPHYTSMLDEIWPEFDDPEERTAARLESLLDEVADEAQRVLTLKAQLWDKLPAYKLPESERKRFDSEFMAYLRRLNDYRQSLGELEPDSTATGDVYLGLVKRRDGAGPVPDAIMHLYSAQQLGILQDHADDMGEGFVGRVMEGLERVDRLMGEAGDAVAESTEEATKHAAEQFASAWEKITRTGMIVGGVLVGSIVAIVGTVAIVRAGKDDGE